MYVSQCRLHILRYGFHIFLDIDLLGELLKSILQFIQFDTVEWATVFYSFGQFPTVSEFFESLRKFPTVGTVGRSSSRSRISNRKEKPWMGRW